MVQVFYEAPKGAPTGVFGLVTSEVGEKTALSNGRVFATVCKFEVWGFESANQRGRLIRILNTWSAADVGFFLLTTGTLKLKKRLCALAHFVFRTDKMSPLGGLRRQ